MKVYFPTFSLEEYVQKLDEIRIRKMIGWIELAKELDVSYNTLKDIISSQGKKPFSVRVMRNIRKFVDENR